MNAEPLPVDDASTFYNDASCGMYNDMVHELFPDSPDVDAESSDALVPVVRPSRPKEKHNSLSRTAYGGPPSEIKKATPPHQLPKIAVISRGNFGMPKSRYELQL
jgi:hypothetical protein